MASKKSFPNSKRGGGGTDYGLTGHSGGMDPDAEIPEYAELRFSEVKARDEMDLKMGFYRHTEGNEPKLGWLVNMHPVSERVDETAFVTETH